MFITSRNSKPKADGLPWFSKYVTFRDRNRVHIGSAETKCMNRAELEQFIMENYGVEPDYPWLKYPGNAVFRHVSNRKWFALIMDVPRNKLGLQGTKPLDVVNLKCDPVLIGSLRGVPGIFPAYHMNKEKWITVALDGSASDDKIRMLLDMSYDATAPKVKKRR